MPVSSRNNKSTNVIQASLGVDIPSSGNIMKCFSLSLSLVALMFAEFDSIHLDLSLFYRLSIASFTENRLKRAASVIECKSILQKNLLALFLSSVIKMFPCFT